MRKLSKESSITLAELPATQDGTLQGELSHNVYSRFGLPARAIPALEGILRFNGFTNIRSVRSYDPEIINNSEVYGVSPLINTTPQSVESVKAYKKANPNGIAIAGGMPPTFEPKAWQEAGIDIIFLGEADQAIVEVMERLEQGYEPGNYPLDDILSLIFRKGKDYVHTGKQEFLTPKELSKLPHPHYSEKTRVAVIETARGCPRGCRHCAVTTYWGKYRMKSDEYVLEELERIKDIGTSLFWIDDNLTLNRKRSIPLLKRIKDNGLARLGSAQLDVSAAKSPELLQALKDAGIYFIYVGIESIFDDVLTDLGKPFSAKQTKEAIEIFREAGLLVHGMTMFGGDKDTPERIKEASAWIKEHVFTVQPFAYIPLPGTPFWAEMQEQGRILTNEYHLYDGHGVIVRPKNFTPIGLQDPIDNLLRSFYSPDREKNLDKILEKFPNNPIIGKLFYRNISRGILNALNSPQHKNHLEFLKKVS
ncbi:B12-binding domain-containing radical SAM protein [Candidatus Woesearchaeota archaeon]|nr:B12-binding domain-containing radical SAM protein [Candidatus Woesearchaeota archaeon]